MLFAHERGYLSPEYARSGKLTEKADVYSFGLVILEIVSGRKVVDNNFEADEDNLLDWVSLTYLIIPLTYISCTVWTKRCL